MSILLWKTKKSIPAFKKTITIYSQLFLLTAFLLVMVTTFQYKQTWLPVVENLIKSQEQTQTDKVNAIPVSADEDISFSPLMEEVEIKSSMHLKAPHILQLPELPRGCEVTSLTMLLQYHDIDVDKMTLAEEVKKDSSPYKVKDDKTYFGNPHKGFVGDMYSFSEPGYGVYHEPLTKLAEQYMKKERVADLSGQSFYRVLQALNQEQPVLVIINAEYEKLPKSSFQTWYTTEGPIEITMNEHSVLVTGYDKDYIYFNDPLGKQEKAPFEDFIEAWEQMGSQAITIKSLEEKQEI